MKQYRVLVFPKNGFSFYAILVAFSRGDARASAQSMYPDAQIGPIEEL